jgi:hypothetical protein
MEEYPCFGTDCKKGLKQFGPPDSVQVIEVAFRDPAGMLRTSYTRASIKREMIAQSKKNGREFGARDNEFLQKFTIISEVAKAYYVDKTLQDSDVYFR